MRTVLFNKNEYDKIPAHLCNQNNVIMKKYKDGYSLSQEGEEEMYFYRYPEKGTDSSGRKKILQAFRTPLMAIITVAPLNAILTAAIGIALGTATVLSGGLIIGLNVGFILVLGLGAWLLPKLWKKSKPEEAQYGFKVKEVDERDINLPMNLEKFSHNTTFNRRSSVLSRISSKVFNSFKRQKKPNDLTKHSNESPSFECRGLLNNNLNAQGCSSQSLDDDIDDNRTNHNCDQNMQDILPFSSASNTNSASQIDNVISLPKLQKQRCEIQQNSVFEKAILIPPKPPRQYLYYKDSFKNFPNKIKKTKLEIPKINIIS